MKMMEVGDQKREEPAGTLMRIIITLGLLKGSYSSL
jgi:hypothetical protein